MSNTVSVSLHLDHLRHNYGVTKRIAAHADVYAVLKSDAYGHGLLQVARALRHADGFALLDLDDAIVLRKEGFLQSILMMAGVNDARELAEACQHRLTVVVRSWHQFDMLRAFRPQFPLHVWVKVKSNINRFGFAPEEVPDLLRELTARPEIRLQGLMMHFAAADDLDCDLDGQWATFRALTEQTQLPFSAANSAAMLRDTSTHGRLVRIGSALYGNNPFVDAKPFDALQEFRPVMRFDAKIVGSVRLQAGEAIGYGGTFVAECAMHVGIVGCGYGDGYPHGATTGTPVLVRGTRSRILGNVAMNAMFVDLGPVPAAQVGDWVTLWGDERLRIDEVARHAGQRPEAIECNLAKKHDMHLIEADQLCET
jgi:alanine racemase